MRIISGNFKGASLYIAKNKNTRPLKDLARESIFNLLLHSNKLSFQLKSSTILDLYSGTGSFGLECLSRQAKIVYFVENEKSAFNILKKNIEKLKIKKHTKLFFDDVINLIKKQQIFGTKFDLIFCDPPFIEKKIDVLLKSIFDKGLLNKNGYIIMHRNKITDDKLPDYFKIIEERIYGTSKITFGKFTLKNL